MPSPPPVHRENLVEELHGQNVADPYRWLEAGADNAAVADFIRTQNDHSGHYLADLADREAFSQRLTALWDRPRRSTPFRRGRVWFQMRNTGLQNQDVLWRAPADTDNLDVVPAGDTWQVLLDPNTWTDDGTASLTGLSATDDGSLVAFARSDAGSDWMRWQVVEVSTGTVRADDVPWSKFSSAAWLPDASGFLYGRYPQPAPGSEHEAATRNMQLCLHRVGTSADDDEVIYERPDQPDWAFTPHVSSDGAWLVVSVWRGTDPSNRVYAAPITDGSVGAVTAVLDEADAQYRVIGVIDNELLVLSDLHAPSGRVLAVSLESGAKSGQIREVIPATDDRLEDAVLIGTRRPEHAGDGWLVCQWLHHATSRLTVHDPRHGAQTDVIALPELGTVGALGASDDGDVLHLTFETFASPSAVLRHDLDAGVTSILWEPAFAAEHELVVEQVAVRHSDVEVPLFVVRRADVHPDGHRPTVLWGYGGFDIPVTPMFRAPWRAWVDAGGVLAVACLRGGGEYGRAWHDDGRLGNKQHVFDDALACAAWLTGQRCDEVSAAALQGQAATEVVWSEPTRLGIEGGSNGGLLVGACITQAPEAFGAAVPQVGVLDMVRFHRFTIGWAWTSDYGSPEDPEDLATLLAYSPYHRLDNAGVYPPTLITTGDTDDRVVPMHSFKFAAALQHAQAGDAPVLLRIETSAGHGAGKPVSKQVEERADILGFYAHHLGLEKV